LHLLHHTVNNLIIDFAKMQEKKKKFLPFAPLRKRNGDEKMNFRTDLALEVRENLEGKHHAQNLAVYVEEILRENDLDADELDAVAVGKGPGSYTGLRIAVSLAQGICYATGKPLIAVNSLEALVQVALEDFEAGILDLESLEDAKLLPMIDARRMEVYCQLFDAQAGEEPFGIAKRFHVSPAQMLAANGLDAGTQTLPQAMHFLVPGA